LISFNHERHELHEFVLPQAGTTRLQKPAEAGEKAWTRITLIKEIREIRVNLGKFVRVFRVFRG
jgi:hypothetical protein